jgi:hypothetical protein
MELPWRRLGRLTLAVAAVTPPVLLQQVQQPAAQPAVVAGRRLALFGASDHWRAAAARARNRRSLWSSAAARLEPQHPWSVRRCGPPRCGAARARAARLGD